MRIFVPYLASSTNVGTRQHWSRRKREVDTCHLIVRNAVNRAGLTPVECQVDLVFTPRLGKGVRRRDTSNYSLSMKHLEDGLVAAGLLPDDRGEFVRRIILEPPEIDRKAETGTWVEIIPVGEGEDIAAGHRRIRFRTAA
ncbi:hypothetical protein ACUN9Y_19710 [Halomonas sp. V046]|uniref:hypothetical protein n=1 Tax=Halomonas sp. V046 TaxID=3459611 RepID=UPI004043A11B